MLSLQTLVSCTHIQSVGLTENEGEEKSFENLKNENEKSTDADKTIMDEVCSGAKSQNGGEEPNEATEDGGTKTDKQDEKEKDPEKKSEAIGPNTEQVKAMDMKIWIGENFSVVPKKTDKILKKEILSLM